jgi:hypothetical protein
MELKLPFNADTPAQLEFMIINEPHPAMSKLYSAALKGAVDRMLTKVGMGKEGRGKGGKERVKPFT